MAKSGKRRIPAKQGAKRARTAPARAITPAPSTEKRIETVRALRLGEYGGRYLKPNDVFTMEVTGELPFWVERV